eukprot:2946276-Rhodomonas_salina.3
MALACPAGGVQVPSSSVKVVTSVNVDMEARGPKVAVEPQPKVPAPSPPRAPAAPSSPRRTRDAFRSAQQQRGRAAGVKGRACVVTEESGAGGDGGGGEEEGRAGEDLLRQ